MARHLTILDLPVKIRERICQYAQFTGNMDDLNYNYNLELYPQDEYPETEHNVYLTCFSEGCCTISRREEYYTLAEYWEVDRDANNMDGVTVFDCPDPACPMSDEGQSCRDYFDAKATHPELFRIMMQKNQLRVCQSSPGGFKPFFELRDDVLAELGTLTVRLDGEPVQTIALGGNWQRLDKLRPYNLRSRYGKLAMKEWKQLVTRLAKCIQPANLTLYIIMKAPDVKTAAEILKPLEDLRPLRGLGLFLHEKHVPGLIQLAKSTTEHLTRVVNASKAPFRYLDLPQELRYRVLEHSDLISSGVVEWKPPMASIAGSDREACSCYSFLHEYFESIGHLDTCTLETRLTRASVTCAYDWGRSNGLLEYHELVHCCSSTTRYSHDTRGDLKSCRKDSNGFCACAFQCNEHSAYTNTAKKSRWGPHPLFLTSRVVRQDAITVFFQRNRFVITPPDVIPLKFVAQDTGYIKHWLARGEMKATELSIFLSVVPSHSMRYLRYLEWALPSNWRYSSSAMFDHLDTIEMMANAIHLPKLTLVVNIRAIGTDDPSEWPYWPKRYHMKDKYDALLMPLCRLKGLKDCFIYLRRLRQSTWHQGGEHGGCVFDNDEIRYERAIMGDSYDSRSRGKPMVERYERALCRNQCTGYYSDFVEQV